MTNFEDDIFTLNVIIDLIYEQRIIPDLDKLSNKYDNVLSNKGSIEELTNIFKPNISIVLTMVSPKYKNQLLQYFSDDGLIFYVYAMFQKHMITDG